MEAFVIQCLRHATGEIGILPDGSASGVDVNLTIG
jgi:hypothetical protein